MVITTVLLTYPTDFYIILPVMQMILTKVRHDWPEARGFQLIRPKGYPEYTFLHFCTPVTLEQNGESIEVEPGGCILFPPDMPQFFTANAALVHNWLHANKDLTPLLERYGIPVGEVFYPRDPGFITEHFRKMELELFSGSSHKEDLLDGYLREFLILLGRALEENSSPAPVKNTEWLHIKEMRQKVLSKPTRKWTVAEMAELVRLSPSRYHAVYKAMFGISPMQDLIEARVEHAKSLLLQYSELPLPKIAEKLGYNDQFHFIRQFRQETGMTPGQYRKKNTSVREDGCVLYFTGESRCRNH